MMTGMVQDKNLEKQIERQMGCMAGFLQIFDRHHILTGKRFYTAKRFLPPSEVDFLSPESEKSVVSPATTSPSSLDPSVQSLAAKEFQSPLPEHTTLADNQTKPLPIFEFKEGTRSPWKLSREAPRHSLDSKAIFDAKASMYLREIRTNTSILAANSSETAKDNEEGNKQRRSTSVIARLMGLESSPGSEPEPVRKPELRRSASESRICKDFYQNRSVEGNGFHLKHSLQANSQNNATKSNAATMNHCTNSRVLDLNEFGARNVNMESMKASNRGIRQRKSFFDSAEVFPEPKQNITVCGEIEKRLKKRGIEEPSKDLETLKHILEALQLKGLLHARRQSVQIDQRNFVYDRTFSQSESPIVVMKPAKSPAWTNRSGRIVNESPSPPPSFRSRNETRRNINVAADSFPAMSLRRELPEIDRNVRNRNRGRNTNSPTGRENSVKSPSQSGGLTNIETQRRGYDPVQQKRISPVQSPKTSSRRIGSDSQITSGSQRSRKRTVERVPKEEKLYVLQVEEESSTASESGISTSSQTDTERSHNKDGRSLLERCDKLLHSIAEITTSELPQPSPISVLDSSFYKDESSPSPVLKRQIDFTDDPMEVEDNIWTGSIFSEEGSENPDFIYVSEILRASNYFPEETDIFMFLERQQCLKGRDASKVSKLDRKLVFDTVYEILNRNRELLSRKSVSLPTSDDGDQALFRKIWSDFRRIQDRDHASGDLLEIISGVLRKDLDGDKVMGWRDCPIEMSEMVLDIERLIFKDVIGETIGDLVMFRGKCNSSYDSQFHRRKLVF